MANQRREDDAILRVDRTTGDVLAAIDLPDSELDAFGLGVTPSAVWTFNFDTGAILRLSTATLEPVVVETRSAPEQIAYFAGSIWVGDAGPKEIIRYDPFTGRTIAILDEAYGTLLAGDDELFIFDGTTLYRVDDNENTLSPVVSLHFAPDAAGPHPATVGGESVWLAVR